MKKIVVLAALLTFALAAMAQAETLKLLTWKGYAPEELVNKFQKETGMEGIGAVTTSSPSSPTSGVPSGERASTPQPSARQLISPSQTGTSGEPPTKAVHTSVPPETDSRWTDGLIASYT